MTRLFTQDAYTEYALLDPDGQAFRIRYRRLRITPYVGASAQTPKVITGRRPRSTTVTRLTTGTTYRFTVQALNPNGAGPVSAQTERGHAQAAGRAVGADAVAAQPASQSVRVTGPLPESDGDSPIAGAR